MSKKVLLFLLSVVSTLDASGLVTKIRTAAPLIKNACRSAQGKVNRNFSSMRTNVAKLPERMRSSAKCQVALNTLKNTQRSLYTTLAAQQQSMCSMPVIKEVRAVDTWIETIFNDVMKMNKEEVKNWFAKKMSNPEEIKRFFVEILDNAPGVQQWVTKVFQGTRDIALEKMTELTFLVMQIYKKFGINTWHDYKMSTVYNTLGKGALVKLGVASFFTEFIIEADIQEAKNKLKKSLKSLRQSQLDEENEKRKTRLKNIKYALEHRAELQKKAVETAREKWFQELSDDQFTDKSLFEKALQNRYTQEAQAVRDLNKQLHQLKAELN